MRLGWEKEDDPPYTFHTYTCLKENLFVLNDTIHLKNGCIQLFF